MLTFGLLDGPDTRNKEKNKYETYSMAGFTRRQNDMKEKMKRLMKYGEINMKITPGSGICSINNDMKAIKTTPMSMTTSASTTTQNKIKPSIFAMLEELYFDIFHNASEVNTNTPQFIAMSERMKNKIYKRDVHELYRIVTGGKEPGDEIKTLSDVSRYINDNDTINKWCEKNKDLEIKITDNERYNPVFVKYIKHIQNMNYNISKQRKSIVKILDRVFNVMTKNEDVLQEIEERQGEAGFKRYTGFEQDDQYSRDFFRLNLKYDFFINPNLTDAELQVLINETRSRIVRLYAESYKYFLAGFKILQELQENIEIDVMVKTAEMAKKETENPSAPITENKKKYDTYKPRILIEEKAFSDDIYVDLANINGEIAKRFREKYEEFYNEALSSSNETTKSEMTNKIKYLNLFVVKNILEVMKPTDINQEIKRNIITALDEMSKKQSRTTNEQQIQSQ